MAYLGNTPTSQSFIAGTDYFSGNGTTTSFTLSRMVASVNDIEVLVNNVAQIPNSYSALGTTLTLSAAPSTGTQNIYVRYLSTTTVNTILPNGTSTTFDTITYTGGLIGGTGIINIGAGQIYKDASGNVGIGTANPISNARVSFGNNAGTTPALWAAYFGTNTALASVPPNFGISLGWNFSGGNGENNLVYGTGIGGLSGLAFAASNGTTTTEHARFDVTGNWLMGVNNTGFNIASNVGFAFQRSLSIPGAYTTMDVSGGGNTWHLYNKNATNNGYRFYVGVAGGIFNYSGNNSNLSDQRTKTNIQLSGSYLNKICSIPVKLFNYKDEAKGTQRTLGVIAQDVEIFAPELVNNEGFGETPEDGVPLKSIYTTDLQFALMKCIQEQQALIESLTTRLTALEAK